MALSDQDAAAAGGGPLVLCGDKDKAGQGLVVLWQMNIGGLYKLSTFNGNARWPP